VTLFDDLAKAKDITDVNVAAGEARDHWGRARTVVLLVLVLMVTVLAVGFVVGERERRHSDAERAEIVRQLDEIEATQREIQATQREILRLVQP
jgi:hypothetical protein